MAINISQGGMCTMTVQGEDNYLNAEMDSPFNTMYHRWTIITQNTPDPMEERFPRFLNNDSVILFSEYKCQTNAEVSFIHIVYKLLKVK